MTSKIITCAPIPPPHGGIAQWYGIFLTEANKNGYEVLNIDTSPKKSIAGRSLFYRVFVQGFRMLSQRKELSKLIKNNKDVKAAHITTSGSLALVRDVLFLRLLKRKGIRSIYHIHFGRMPEIFEKKGLEHRFIKKAISLASEVIAIDPNTNAVLRENFKEEKIHYIPNPVRRLEEVDFTASKNVLFLGNVLKTKGVEELLCAWKELSDDYSDWTLTIAGFCEKSYLDYLESRYSLRGVSMLGFLPHDEAIEELKKSAFLVLPSYTEGFPNVVIEAMMCKKAVLATDVGAIRDILSGGCGTVISARNSDELRDAMKAMMDDKALLEKMGEIGRAKALNEYSSDIVFNHYADLWER